MKSEHLGKTLTRGRCAASGSLNSRLSMRLPPAALAINRIQSAISADRMLHRL
jgi:hypothetical protein